MLCWPDVWDQIKNFGPMMSGFVLLLGYAVLVALLLWAPMLRKRWLRMTSRLLGVAGLVPLVVAIVAILLGIALNAGNPPAKIRVTRSTDGQEAKLTYRAGFLGRDHTDVTLKRNGCCRHTTVFSHSGPSWFDDPKVEWLGNHHLYITYHSRPDDPQQCDGKAGEITITCVSSPWPDSSPSSQVSP